MGPRRLQKASYGLRTLYTTPANIVVLNYLINDHIHLKISHTLTQAGYLIRQYIWLC